MSEFMTRFIKCLFLAIEVLYTFLIEGDAINEYT